MPPDTRRSAAIAESVRSPGFIGRAIFTPLERLVYTVNRIAVPPYDGINRKAPVSNRQQRVRGANVWSLSIRDHVTHVSLVRPCTS